MESTPSNKKGFLSEKNIPFRKKHQEYLGMDMPSDYFSKSKQSILTKIQEEKQPKTGKLIAFNSRIQYLVAAGVAVLLFFNLWLFNVNSSNEQQNFELLTASENVLLNSLLVDDEEMEAYTNDLIINEIVIKAELTEQKIDNFFINSLFVEDSLIDSYTNDEFIKTLIL